VQPYALDGDAAAMAAAAGAGRSVGPSDGPTSPGGLHVAFRAVDLAACEVSATVVYDPLADVHVLPRAVSTLFTVRLYKLQSI
jgi:hypothetical protein